MQDLMHVATKAYSCSKTHHYIWSYSNEDMEGVGAKGSTLPQQILTYHFKVLNEQKIGLGPYGKQITPPPSPEGEIS